MGTRNLIAVQIDGKYKVAQYSQFDGYPEGQGLNCLRFLREQMNEYVFKDALRNSSFITADEMKEMIKSYGGTDNAVDRSMAEEKLLDDHPEFNRDTGADILKIIQEHPGGLKLTDELDFVGDGLFCEWAWVIDFDKRTFEGYKGFNTTPLTPEDRFYNIKSSYEGYTPVKIVASFSLDDLPGEEEFLAAFGTEE